jgi:hypothetical protein
MNIELHENSLEIMLENFVEIENFTCIMEMAADYLLDSEQLDLAKSIVDVLNSL